MASNCFGTLGYFSTTCSWSLRKLLPPFDFRKLVKVGPRLSCLANSTVSWSCCILCAWPCGVVSSAFDLWGLTGCRILVHVWVCKVWSVWLNFHPYDLGLLRNFGEHFHYVFLDFGWEFTLFWPLELGWMKLVGSISGHLWTSRTWGWFPLFTLPLHF